MGDVMGIVRTDEWLKEDFEYPNKICKKLVPFFKGMKETEIYNELMNFGMYHSSRGSSDHLDYMFQQNLWEKVEKIFHSYKQKWGGPDIPIFLFPLARSRGLFVRQDSTKSGVSYPDKMFLFVSRLEDLNELKALFIHEYHHVCRLGSLSKKMEDFTLLDSIIIEGLAEYAVLKNCGPDYLAKWCKMYSDKELSKLWERYVSKNLHIKKSEKLHDEILYGGRRVPPLLGYAIGFNIVEKYYQKNRYSTKTSFAKNAENYLGNKNNTT